MQLSGIKIARERCGLTIFQLSKILKLDIYVIMSWENGVGNIPYNILLQLMSILNTSSEILLFGVDKKPLNIDTLKEHQKKFIINFYDFIKENPSLNNKSKAKKEILFKDTKIITSIPQKITYLRENILDINQSQFGKMINVTRGSVSNWESGISKPTLSHISMICTICHITTDYLLLDKHPLEISARNLTEDEYKILQCMITFFIKKNSEEKHEKNYL